MSNDLPTDSTDVCEPSIDSFLRAVASDTYEQRQLALLEADAALARRLVPGALIADRYRLERLLRAGGMGIVWAASHAITGRQVALKFLKTSWALDERSRRRFLQEARAATAVRHPNVVEVFDVLDVGGETPLIVMELLTGETLGDRLAREGRLSVEETASLLAPVVSAVGTAHSCGIVHRDLKPDNIFLLRGGPASVKVLDFGIAKLTGAARSSDDTAIATGSGATLGTPRYMAPEQLRGDTDLDHRADIWALGAILYECLSGQRAVKGINIAQAALQLAGPGVVPIARVAPHVPRALAELIDRMLASEQSARPKSLHEVRDALARWGCVQTPSFDRPLFAGRTGDALESVPSSRRRFVRSPRRALAAVSCVLALAAVVTYQLRSGAAEAAPRSAARSARPETVPPPDSPVTAPMPPPAVEPRGVERLDAPSTTSFEPAAGPAPVAARRVRAKKKPSPAPVVEQAAESNSPQPFRGGLVERVPF